jgi:lipopolysaccharide export LptBFGC system permease protein LptF
MKTVKLTSAIATFSLVLFMSLASIANSGNLMSGDMTRSGKKNLDITNTSDKDFSYLRFDVNKFIKENDETDLIHNSLDYLRFDVNDFASKSETIEMELPAANDFEYLRFNVTNFTESNPNDIIDLPVNEFDYLRFDVSNYTAHGESVNDELPVTE